MDFLDTGTVHRLLDYARLIDALAAHHRENVDGGHLDLMVARHLYALAAARGTLGADEHRG